MNATRKVANIVKPKLKTAARAFKNESKDGRIVIHFYCVRTKLLSFS